jgi:hypothetical protein
VSNQLFIDRKSIVDIFPAENILPRSGGVAAAIRSYVDADFPLTEFIYEYVTFLLADQFEFDAEKKATPLTQVGLFESSEDFAAFLVQKFESLPWRYLISIQLPGSISELLTTHQLERRLSDTMTICRATEQFEVSFPSKSGNERRDRNVSGMLNLFAPAESHWVLGATYLMIEVEGFSGHFGKTIPLMHAESLIKAFCGLGIGLHLFKIAHSFRLSPAERNYLVHQKRGDDWEIFRKVSMDAAASGTFSDLALEDFDGELNEEALRRHWIESKLAEMEGVLSNMALAERVVLAAQWLFDSFGRSNDLLSFLQAMAVLEILFGEESSPELSLGALLKNRCAYLIGKTSRQRSQIMKDFAEIYAVRSQIVHRGKATLTAKERAMLSKLQWLASRAIDEETKLILADAKERMKQA